MSAEKRESELKRAECTDGVLCQTHIGGQALLEGVMMRGKYSWACAIRTPEGDIYTEEHDLKTRQDRHGWLYWPLIRGCRALIESLVLGFKALDIAAEHAYDLEEDEEKPAEPEATEADPVAEFPAVTEEAEEEGESKSMKVLMAVSMVLGVALGVAIFIMVPALLANLIVGPYENHFILWNIVDGIARVVIFIAYIWAIAFMKDIKRMFAYHGAEHKTIHAFEHGDELTPANAQRYPTLHVRCGTAFVIMVLILAIIIYTFVPIKEICIGLGVTSSVGRYFIIVASRILFLPLIAGIGYEITVKWAGSRPDNKLVKVILWPGLQMQRLTTRQPDDSMLECAIAAMRIVLERERVVEAEKAAKELADEHHEDQAEGVRASA
ncbi:MAG: DUF1385 domain-containing protein [Coriobacteriales bacterium]|nr:DUF1385 domain-containing protein [Coriobacteriales bacterium]